MITDPEPPTMAPIRTDETGAIYVPLYPAPGMRSVPLGVHDLLHLWHVNRQLSQTAAARGDVTEWTAAAVNADVFLGIAAELEPSLARLKALRGPGKPFQAGQSGNPNGTRPGHRHPAFAALDAIGQDGAEAVIRKVVEDHVRQCGVIYGVGEMAIDQAAMVAMSVDAASIVGGISSAIASVCI